MSFVAPPRDEVRFRRSSGRESVYEEGVQLDPDACHRALKARDRRFDGLFFVGVTTTGVYCRPGCPAPMPGRARCRFYRRAAQAEAAGFRACFRCRPELAPAAGPNGQVSRLVRRAAARIEEGALNHMRVPELAQECGVTPRHLRRVFKRELGVTPIELAQWSRLALAKQLLQDSRVPLTQVAFGSGYSSLRRFNASFRERFGRPPSAVRRTPEDHATGLGISLGYREPLAWDALLAFMRARAVTSVESFQDGRYRRTMRLSGASGWVEARRVPENRTVRVLVSPSLIAALPMIARRARHVFDLDADPVRVEAHLRDDEAVRQGFSRTPGLRVPGTFDLFELCVRAILGQQVSVRAATTAASRLAARFGEPIETPWPELDCLAPSPARLARTTTRALTSLGLTTARAGTIRELARRFADGEFASSTASDPDELRAALLGDQGDRTVDRRVHLHARARGARRVPVRRSGPSASPRRPLCFRARGTGAGVEAVARLRSDESLEPMSIYYSYVGSPLGDIRARAFR